MAITGFNNNFFGYDTVLRETEQSMDNLKRKLEAEAKAAARKAEESKEETKSTQVFSPSEGNDQSAAGAWADPGMSLNFKL